MNINCCEGKQLVYCPGSRTFNPTKLFPARKAFQRNLKYMSIPNLSTSQLNHLLSLTKERDLINQQIADLFGGTSTPSAAVTAPRASTAPRATAAKASPGGRRGGTLKDQIVALLQSEGTGGLSIGEVANRIGAKKSSVNFWFYTAGKKVKGLKKVSRGTFAYRG